MLKLLLKWLLSAMALLAVTSLYSGVHVASFATAMAGHFRTSLAAAPLSHYVQLVYRILIPLIIGLMVLYIVLDIIYRLRKRVARGGRS